MRRRSLTSVPHRCRDPLCIAAAIAAREEADDLRLRLALANERAVCPMCGDALAAYRDRLNQIEARLHTLLGSDRGRSDHKETEERRPDRAAVRSEP